MDWARTDVFGLLISDLSSYPLKHRTSLGNKQMSEIFLGSESFLGTIVTFGFAVVGIWISSLIRGLDILGYVSTTSHDSPYVSISGNESTVDGTEKSGKYGSMKLKLVDTGDNNKKVGGILQSRNAEDLAKAQIKDACISRRNLPLFSDGAQHISSPHGQLI
jgi:hypothetical protein